MQRIIVLIYAIVTGIIAITCTILETQPALFIIDIFAPHDGDRYSATLVMLLVWIILLSPLIVFFVIARLIRNKVDENIELDRTGVLITRKKSFQSALVGLPIYINDKKAGIVDNGGTKFFDVPMGMITVRAGQGKQVSEKLNATIAEGEQLHFEIQIKQAGLFVKIVLKQV
jgi:hypothetical protein